MVCTERKRGVEKGVLKKAGFFLLGGGDASEKARQQQKGSEVSSS